MVVRAAATYSRGAGQLHTDWALLGCASSSIQHLVWRRLQFGCTYDSGRADMLVALEHMAASGFMRAVICGTQSGAIQVQQVAALKQSPAFDAHAAAP